MPDERDRILARLAVEGGFLSREEAGQYWQRIQAPNAPRLVHLLVQDGRISQADLQALRERFLQSQGGAPPAQAAPPPAAPQPGGEETWEEKLEKDTFLARVLLERGVTTMERLRECRQLQIQHQMRLGVVLVRKGYVDKQTVEQAIGLVKQHLGNGAQSPSTQRHGQFQPPSTRPTGRPVQPTIVHPDDQPTLMGNTGPAPPDPLSNPFASVRGQSPLHPGMANADTLLEQGATLLDGPTPGPPVGMGGKQDHVPTVLNNPAARPPGTLSVEELNPFANVPPSMPGGGLNPFAQHEPPHVSMPSIDELDAFTDIPLPPPPGQSAGEHLAAPAAGPFGVSDSAGSPPIPVSDSVMAPTKGPIRASGLTPTGVPVGGTADSDSARNRAPRKVRRVVKKKSNTSTLVIILLVASIVLAGGVFFLINNVIK